MDPSLGRLSVRFVEVDESRPIEEILVASDLDYRVGLCFMAARMPEESDLRDQQGRTLFFHDPNEKTSSALSGEDLPSHIPVAYSSHLGVIATDRLGNRWPLGVVGAKYTVKQNSDFVQDAKAVAVEWKAGLAKVGRNPLGTVVAASFEPRVDMITALSGDSQTLQTYLFSISSHDRTYAYSFFVVCIDSSERIVFTFSSRTRAATDVPTDETDAEYRSVKGKHTKGILDSSDLVTAVTNLGEAFKQFLLHAQVLAQTRVDDSEVSEFLQKVFPTPKSGSVEVARKVEESRNSLREQFASDSSSFRGTGWGLYLAWLSLVHPDNFGLGRTFSSSAALEALLKGGSSKQGKALKELERIREDLFKLLQG